MCAQELDTPFSGEMSYEPSSTTRKLLLLALALLVVLEASILRWSYFWFRYGNHGASLVLNKWTALFVPAALLLWSFLTQIAVSSDSRRMSRLLGVDSGQLFVFLLIFACFWWPSLDALKGAVSGTKVYGWINNEWGIMPLPGDIYLTAAVYTTIGLAAISFWNLWHVERRRVAILCAVVAFVIGLVLAGVSGPSHPSAG